jgi:hypothetical protein
VWSLCATEDSTIFFFKNEDEDNNKNIETETEESSPEFLRCLVVARFSFPLPEHEHGKQHRLKWKGRT